MRNISTRFSVVRLLGIVRRHIRLLKQVFNAENLINQIKPDFDSLEAKQAEIESKNTARENAYDDMVLADNLADDAVRNLFDACQQFDRNNPGSNVTLRIFPDEKFGEIIRLPLASELLQIEKLVIRLKELGEGHSLSSYVTELQTKSAAVKSAIGVFEDSLHSVKTAEAEAEIAKEALIRKYELNYLEARKTYGKKDAEKLFPKLRSPVTDKEGEEEEQNQQEAA